MLDPDLPIECKSGSGRWNERCGSQFIHYLLWLCRMIYFLACVFNTIAMMSSCLMLVFVVLLPAATYVGRYHIMVIIILGAAMLGRYQPIANIKEGYVGTRTFLKRLP